MVSVSWALWTSCQPLNDTSCESGNLNETTVKKKQKCDHDGKVRKKYFKPCRPCFANGWIFPRRRPQRLRRLPSRSLRWHSRPTSRKTILRAWSAYAWGLVSVCGEKGCQHVCSARWKQPPMASSSICFGMAQTKLFSNSLTITLAFEMYRVSSPSSSLR